MLGCRVVFPPKLSGQHALGALALWKAAVSIPVVFYTFRNTHQTVPTGSFYNLLKQLVTHHSTSKEKPKIC